MWTIFSGLGVGEVLDEVFLDSIAGVTDGDGATGVVAVVVVFGVVLFSANHVLRAVSHSIHFVLREPAMVCNLSLRPGGIFSY